MHISVRSNCSLAGTVQHVPLVACKRGSVRGLFDSCSAHAKHFHFIHSALIHRVCPNRTKRSCYLSLLVIIIIMPTEIKALLRDDGGGGVGGLAGEHELCALSYDPSDEPTEVVVPVTNEGGNELSTEKLIGLSKSTDLSLTDDKSPVDVFDSCNNAPPLMDKSPSNKMPKRALSLRSTGKILSGNNSKGIAKENASPQQGTISRSFPSLGCKTALFASGGGSNMNNVKNNGGSAASSRASKMEEVTDVDVEIMVEKTLSDADESNYLYCNQGGELNQVNAALSNHTSAVLGLMRQTAAKGEKRVPESLLKPIRKEIMTVLRTADFPSALSRARALIAAENGAIQLYNEEVMKKKEEEEEQQQKRLQATPLGGAENEGHCGRKSVLVCPSVNNISPATTKRLRPDNENESEPVKKRSKKKECSCDDPKENEQIGKAIEAVEMNRHEKPSAGTKLMDGFVGGTVRPSGKWQAQLYYAGKSRYIGVFESLEDACYAYEVARQVLMTCNDPKDDEVDANINLARKAAFAGVGGNVAKNMYRHECSTDGCTNVTCFSSIKSALDNHRNKVLSLLWKTAAKGENLASYASLLYRVREETTAALRDANFLSPMSKALSEAEDDAGRLFSQTKEAVEEALESLEDEYKDGNDNRRKSVELLESINRRANREKSPSPSMLGVGTDGQCGTMSVVLANTAAALPTTIKRSSSGIENEKGPANKRSKKKYCCWEGCKNGAKRGGVCWRHGAKNTGKRCSSEGCTNYAQRGGVCVRHGAKVKRCSWLGCTNNAVKGGECRRHGAKDLMHKA